jgi:16S rRNA C967 or C1407 C5-methylase (RsmB/RsmF family)/NOL1/NOP2/fmu family ribosome biogenesis protein
MTNEKYPLAFIDTVKAQLGEELPLFLEALDSVAPVSVRLNPSKPTSLFAKNEKISWAASNGRYLPERPVFTLDPLLHAGAYYVQEASSMFLETVWNSLELSHQNLNILDLCAAPGGKSTHLLSLMSKASLLVSNEIIPNRNKILRENITKWGNPNVFITQSEADKFSAAAHFFDVVVVDAPCSGEGLFRKDKNAIAEWSEKNVALCSVRQQSILENIVPTIVPGGYLIYSTCTYEPVENDLAVAGWLEKGFSLVRLNDVPQEVTSTKLGYQFYPHRTKGEGFYMAVLQKDGERKARQADVAKPIIMTSQEKSLAETYLAQPDDFTLLQKDERTYAIPQQHRGAFQYLSKVVNIRQAGVYLGEQKGKDFLPSHDLAMSTALSTNLPRVELSLEDALRYLRCETIRIDSPLRGWALVTYQNLPLGWVKLLDNRVNNYYPKEYRILMRG